MVTASTRVRLPRVGDPVWDGVDSDGKRYRYSTEEKQDDCPKCKAGHCVQKVVELDKDCNLIVHDSQDLN